MRTGRNDIVRDFKGEIIEEVTFDQSLEGRVGILLGGEGEWYIF